MEQNYVLPFRSKIYYLLSFDFSPNHHVHGDHSKVVHEYTYLVYWSAKVIFEDFQSNWKLKCNNEEYQHVDSSSETIKMRTPSNISVPVSF